MMLTARAHVLAAASTVLAEVLDGAERDGRVLAVLPAAVHVMTGEPAVPLVCLATVDAVRLPCSLVVRTLPSVEVGDGVVLGGGRIAIGGVDVTPVRWWKPSQPRLRNLRQARRQAATLRLQPTEPVRTALDTGMSPTELVLGLLGLGPGLTPAGDDVLAGALVALRAARDPAADLLASAVAAADPAARTTAVSAALLMHAARGECVPELAEFLDALDGRVDVPAALTRLLAVGATSGIALAAGVRLALLGTGR